MSGWLRLDLVRLALLAVPGLLVHHALLAHAGPAGQGSGRALAVLLALGAVALALAATLRRDSPRALGSSYLLFFLAFTLFFSVAAGTRVLEGERRLLAGYEEALPVNPLGLGRLGDWHYALLPPAPPAGDLLVLTLPSFAGQPAVESRRMFFFLLRQAIEHEARALAFDYYLERESAFDPQLAQEIERAAQAGIPVLFGFRQLTIDGLLVPRPVAATLRAALPAARLGHIAAYQEADGVVRMVPAMLPGSGRLPALGLRLASLLATPAGDGELALPSSGLVRLAPPRGGVAVRPFAPDRDWSILRNRAVLAGTGAASDRVRTPFGAMQGVEVHAWTAHNLRTGAWVRPAPPALAFALVYLVAYVLTLRYARGATPRRLLAWAAGLAVAVLLLAALLIAFARVWLDVAYPLLALATLGALLLGGRAIRAVRRAPVPSLGEEPEVAPASEEAPAGVATAATPSGVEAERAAGAPGAGDASDVFLSHNGRDKPAVRRLCATLRERGLEPWLDEERLVPGRPWQEGLERAICAARAAAVVVGADGLGPWEVPEMRACLSESVRRGLPVIPVLLPGCPSQPVLPLFLTQYTWVDLRPGLTTPAIDRLVWGVTGERPDGRAGVQSD